MLKMNVAIISTISLWTHDVVSTLIRHLYDVVTSYRRVINVEMTSCVYVVRLSFDCINFCQTNRRLFKPLVPDVPLLYSVKASSSGDTKRKHRALIG